MCVGAKLGRCDIFIYLKAKKIAWWGERREDEHRSLLGQDEKNPGRRERRGEVWGNAGERSKGKYGAML